MKKLLLSIVCFFAATTFVLADEVIIPVDTEEDADYDDPPEKPQRFYPLNCGMNPVNSASPHSPMTWTLLLSFSPLKENT